jgi:hypothetical protein
MGLLANEPESLLPGNVSELKLPSSAIHPEGTPNVGLPQYVRGDAEIMSHEAPHHQAV